MAAGRHFFAAVGTFPAAFDAIQAFAARAFHECFLLDRQYHRTKKKAAASWTSRPSYSLWSEMLAWFH
jgi:hypothetical protein